MFKKIISVIILFSNCFLFANGFDDFIQKGDQYFENFDNINAIKHYEKAYELNPDDFDILLRLSRTYNDAGEELKELRKRDEAEKYISKALKISEIFSEKFPDSAEVYAYLALSYGNYAMFVGGKEKIKLAHKIKDNATKSVKMKSNQYLPLVILGIYNRQIADLSWFERTFANTFFGDVPEGSFEESVKMLKKALEIEPNTIVATYQLALTYGKMGDEKQQKELLNKIFTYKEKNFRDKYAKIKAKRILAEI